MTEEEFPFFVTEEEDGSITFTWDKNHPVTSVFNEWTKEDFKDMILEECARVLEEHGETLEEHGE
jgi:hypothetical protein